jgi:hypothetical protein
MESARILVRRASAATTRLRSQQRRCDVASLRSMIIDGRVQILTPGPGKLSPAVVDDEWKHVDQDREMLKSGDPILGDAILVKAQGVLDSLRELSRESPEVLQREIDDSSSIPCPKPPYHLMWLEAIDPGKPPFPRRVRGR